MFQVEIGTVKQKVLGEEKKVDGVERSLKDLVVEVEDIGTSFDNLEITVEILDNFQSKSNLKLLN